MPDSPRPTHLENVNLHRLRRRFAILPSWMLSVLFHAALVLILAAALSARPGGIVGDPDGDFRKIGIYVGHSGGGEDGSGTASGSKPGINSNIPARPFAQGEVASRIAQQPSIADSSATSTRLVQPADTSSPKTPTIETQKSEPAVTPKPAPIIGPAASVDRPAPDSRNQAGQSNASPDDRSSGNPEGSAYGKWNAIGDSPPARGSGNGSGGAVGSLGTAPFFGIWDGGAKFVYVIDCSGSMFSYNAMQAAKTELLASLRSLGRRQQFQIIFYNLDQKWLKAPGNTDCQYFPATELNRRLAGQFVAEVQPDGGTQHLPALELALRLHPDVIFFLTDAGEPEMEPEELDQVRRRNQGRSRIHCVQFGMSDESTVPAAPNFLRKLATQNNGDYAYRNVKQFAAAGHLPEAGRRAKPTNDNGRPRSREE